MEYSKEQLVEIRKQIVPRYFGQFVMKLPDNDDILKVTDWFKFDNAILQLKPLSSITDEEKSVVAFLAGISHADNEMQKLAGNDVLNDLFIENIREYNYESIMSIHQYLQLKGYALPHLVLIDGKPVTLSVEQQIESLIIETKN